MSLARVAQNMPSFSVVLTRSSPGHEPVEVLAMHDCKPASRRQLHLNFQPKDNDSLMRTIDTRFTGSFAYEVQYPQEEKSTHRRASIVSTSSTSSSTSSGEDEDDTTSSASTTELDLNREFQREADTDSGSDTATISDCDVGQLGDNDSPLHRQPAALASLMQAPSLPPRYRKFEVDAASGNPMGALGHGAGTAGSWSSAGQNNASWGNGESNHRAPPPGASSSSRLAGFNILVAILNAFRSLWRRLRKIGGIILRRFTKDL